MVLTRLGNVNYHVKPETGNGRKKVVHRNRLKLVRGNKESNVPNPNEQVSRAEFLPDEPAITQHDQQEVRSYDRQELPTGLRRSTRQRRAPDRYQDFNLEELEIGEALN